VSSDLPLLSAQISVDYPKKPGVLSDVSLEIHHGEIVGLVGESGSGKSTLALALLQLVEAKGAQLRGEVIFQCENLLEKSEDQLRRIRGKQISVVLQSPLTSLNPALRIGAQLLEAWRAHAQGTREEGLGNVRAALRSVCLPDDHEFLDRRPSQLSVGQGQRVIIAMAILHRPALLIADEPTSALDTITQSEILSLFARLNREMGMAILYISHDLLSVASLCHRMAILHNGKIAECQAPERIFEAPGHPYTRKLIGALPRGPLEKAPSGML
jgi:ABC-type dipeptide/oligopeptide/nickel transport system ATPase component